MTSDRFHVAAPAPATVTCPICASPRSKPLFRVKDWTFRVTEETFVVRRCRGCGAGFVTPRPTHEQLAKYYPPDFYWSHEGGGEPLPWEQIVERRRDQLVAKAAVLGGTAPGRLLDIGAQKGEFLWFMRERGWEVEGVELDNAIPNPQALPIRYGDFLSMAFEPLRYDAVTAWAVLEHVDDPAAFLRKASALLKPGGRFVALVTNFNSIQGRLLLADDYPRHLTLFTRRAIHDAAERLGLRVERVWTDQKIFGGALNGGLVYLVKRLGGYSEDEAYLEWKRTDDPLAFWGKWRGVPYGLVLLASRIDRAATWLPERLLDRLGHGFIMTFVLRKPEGARND